MKMIISAGGTGGHIYPALAIIKKFQEKDPNFEVLYIGTHDRMENEIVPKNGIPYESIKIYGFSKKKIGKDFYNIALIIKAYNKCLKIIDKFKPDIIVGVGGYVTFPVILAAKKRKIKCALHEQNMIPGKTNKFLSRGVNAVFTTFETSKDYFDKCVNCIYTGHPCTDNVGKLKAVSKESLGLDKDKKLVMITSGSQGSKGLNGKLIQFLKMVKNASYEVLVVTGKNNYEEFTTENQFSKNVKIIPYLDNMAAFFKNCDLVIGRSGAGTVCELLASHTPSILIPSPNVANNHQYYNALGVEEAKMAIMIEEKDLDSQNLYQKVNSLLKGDDEYQTLKNNLNKYQKPNASEKIYKSIKEIVKNV